MTDPRTAAYLRELWIRLENQKQAAISTAAELCDCPACVHARAKREIPPCEQNKIMRELRDRIIPNPENNNVYIQASPNYDPNTGRLEFKGNPVGMFESNPNPGRIATKWTVKD